jgi:MFS transporter, ACS family, glucarate transporter
MERPDTTLSKNLSPPISERKSGIRYRVLAMCVALAFVTYLDRVCISITAPHIMRELALSPLQMSFVFSAFTTAYALFEIPTGWWGDRVGTRRVLTRIVVWWSCFTALTAAAWNFSSLLIIRFLFGVGEAGAWPNVARTFSRWFPTRERGTAQGIFFMGAHLGGGLTPIVVTFMLAHLPWRAVFVIFASTGFIWAAAWHWWFRDEPREHRGVNETEAAWIEQDRSGQTERPRTPILRAALQSPSVWFLCLMYFTQTYGFMFFITWLPTYLQREKALTGFALSLLSGAPLLFSAAGDLAGGMVTDSLTRRFNLRIGRCLTGGLSLAFASFFLVAGIFTGNGLAAGVLIALAAMSSNFLLGASWGASLDLAGAHAGAISAAMNTAGQVGGILSPIAYALLTRNSGSSITPLLVMAALYFFGALCWWFIHPERPLLLSGAN